MKFLAMMYRFYSHQDLIIFWPTVLSLLIALFIFLFWLVTLPYTPSQIPLFYSLPWGESQMASVNQFILLPAIIVLAVLFNIIISWHLHSSQNAVKRILAISTFVTSFFILIAAMKIIFIFV